MKIYYIFITLALMLIISETSTAQQEAAGGVIRGVIADSISGGSLGYVSISLQRKNFNKILNGAISDDKGKFSIEGVAPGKYRLRLVCVGYENKTVDDIEVRANELVTGIGTIIMSPTASLLKEIEISAHKTLIEQQIDRLVYNVDRDKSATNQSLNELMRKVPMVQVDAEGNLSLRGSRNIQVLINGKPSGAFAANMADALRTIPAEQVSRVEVITMPSARYDAEGTAGIINIITKKKQIEGYNGFVNAAASNLHNNSSASLNMRTAKTGINTMLGLNGMLPQDISNQLIRNTQTATGSSLLTQNGAATADRIAGSSMIGLDYDPNNLHSFSSSFRWAATNASANGIIDVLQQNIESGMMEQSNRKRSINSERSDRSFEWTTDYRRSFNNPQQQWTSSVQWSHVNNNQDYAFYERSVLTSPVLLAEDANNLGTTNEITAQTDYSQTFRKNIQLETGAKHILRMINSLASYAEWQSDRSGFVLNPERNQNLDYTQHITSAYLETRFQLSQKWAFRIGNRLENTTNKIQDLQNAPIKDTYLSWVPGTAITLTLKNTATITGSYARRIQRPGIAQLNPFINTADRLNITLGNPSLRPELTDIIDMSFSMPFKKGFFNSSIFYYYTQNVIEKLTTTDANGIAASIQQNLGISHLAGGNAYLTYQATPVWSFRGGGNANYYTSNNTLNIEGVGNSGVQFNAFLMNGLEFKKGLSIEALLAYAAPQLSVQGKGRAFYTLQATVSQQVFKKKGALTMVIVNPFRHDVVYGTALEGPGFYQTKNTYVPFRMVNVGFSYRFGKAGTLKQLSKKKSVKNTDVKEAEKEQL